MRIHDEARYAAAPEAVAAMLADPAFLADKCRRTGALAHTVEVEGEPSGAFTVTTARTMPTDDFPDIAKKFVGATIVLEQVDSWQAAAADGSRDGEVSMRLAGAPLHLTATMTLRPEGEGTVEVVSGELKAAVPLIGGKLEKAAEPAILAGLRKEHEVGREYLAG